MQRVTFTTTTAGLLASVSADRPDLTVEAYPLGPLTLLRATGDVTGFTAPATWPAGSDVLAAHTTGKHEAAVLLHGADDSPIAVLLAEGAHLIPPVVWTRGLARVTVLLPDSVPVGRIRALFPNARLVAKSDADKAGRAAIESPLLLPAMTPKQAAALAAAFDAGYYTFPRTVRTRDVAADLGVARSTFEQHLNRAEAQVLSALMPVVRLRAHDASDEDGAAAVQSFSRFSRELGLFVVTELAGDGLQRVRLTRDEPKDSAGAHPIADRVVAHAAGGRDTFDDVALDVQATGFERAVLDFLRTIPPGTTLTYGDIARALDKPGAARAVGNACAKNPLLVVIPCHRVVPANGGLGNYAGDGGAETKRRLLDAERGGA